MHEEVRIDKLVHGGQGIGTLADGRRVFVWNALPGEKVKVGLIKTKRNYAEGIAEEILEASPHRQTPRDAAYLSTSPWQVMAFTEENRQKQAILLETMQREGVDLPEKLPFFAGKHTWHYRNKMEYSFWADDSGLHLALYNRGTHQKQIVDGSSIVMPAIDEAAQRIVSILNKHRIRGSQLKTLVIRANQKNEVVAALFVKEKSFPEISELSSLVKGLAVYFSNPKSPASIISDTLKIYGDVSLSDSIMGTEIAYDVNSFFQVNLEAFELAMQHIQQSSANVSPIVDMYSGVGTIGVPLAADSLIEVDPHNIEMAKHNSSGKSSVIHASAEESLQHIPSQGTLIVDPPRAGLHQKVVRQLLLSKPEQIIYLSCNPITQARDLALLQSAYSLEVLEGYNFFPRTPHIESLSIMRRI